MSSIVAYLCLGGVLALIAACALIVVVVSELERESVG